LSVLVTIENVGNDRADSVPFDVTIDLFDGEGPVGRFTQTVTPTEGLGHGDVTLVDIPVRFPCASPRRLRATVDDAHQVPNNLHNMPSREVPSLVPTLVPWLTVALRVGIVASTGTVTFDPDGFCPGLPLVAEVTVANKGCVASKPTTLDFLLSDLAVGQIAIQTYPIPALMPGASQLLFHTFTTPTAIVGNSLWVVARADYSWQNPDTCSRQDLGAGFERPLSAGQPPQLALVVGGGGVIRPGEAPSLSWRVRNDCSDIANADVRILYGTSATELHKTKVTIPLRDTVAEDVDVALINFATMPPAVLNDFWTGHRHRRRNPRNIQRVPQPKRRDTESRRPARTGASLRRRTPTH
jgi:hypothetical protein